MSVPKNCERPRKAPHHAVAALHGKVEPTTRDGRFPGLHRSMERRPMALTELGRHDHIERLANRIGDTKQGRCAGTPITDHAGRVHEHNGGRLRRFHSSCCHTTLTATGGMWPSY